MKEIALTKTLEKKMPSNRIKKGGSYLGLNLEGLQNKFKSLIEVAIQLPKKKKKKIIFHCGLPRKNTPWCATKMDQRGVLT